jgi:hypothetical protein
MKSVHVEKHAMRKHGVAFNGPFVEFYKWTILNIYYEAHERRFIVNV